MSYESMLAAKRSELQADAHRLVSGAAAEKRDLTAAEQARFDHIVADLRSQSEASATLAARQADRDHNESVLAELGSKSIENRTAFKPTETRDLEDKFRSAMLEKNPAPIDVREASPRSYYQPGLEQRALTGGAGNFSGVSFYSKILMSMIEASSVLRAGATVINTDNGEPIRVPRQTGYASATLVTEGSVIPEADPTQNTVTLGAFKYAKLITVSNELAEDAGFDLAGYLAREAGITLGNALGADLINGVGTTAPRGVLLDAGVGVTAPTGCATSLGAQGTAGQGTDLLNSLVGSLQEPYSQAAAAAFLLRTSTLTNVRNLKGTTGDLVGTQYLAQAPAPFYVDPAVANQAANAKSVLFGDWSRVFVRIVNGIRFEQSRDYAWNTDQTVFRAVLRADGALVDTSAIKWLANSAT
jgi:HK97 family phage major capsid protein